MKVATPESGHHTSYASPAAVPVWQASGSSVGRAVDCSGSRQTSIGRWFKSGPEDVLSRLPICSLCPCVSVRYTHLRQPTTDERSKMNSKHLVSPTWPGNRGAAGKSPFLHSEVGARTADVMSRGPVQVTHSGRYRLSSAKSLL